MTQIAQPGAGLPVTKPNPVTTAGRWTTFSHALAFVLGFTSVFVLMGSAFGLLGANLQGYKGTIAQLGAILLLVFALVIMGVFGWAASVIRRKWDVAQNPAAAAIVGVLDWFNQLVYSERRVTQLHEVNRGWGLFSSVLIGVAFSAGWLPCIGPILSSILFLAGDSSTALQGATLLAVYSIGLGIPFLLAGLFLGQMTPLLRRLNRHAHIISLVSGIFLLYVAYLLWTGELQTLTTRFDFLNTFVIGVEDQVSDAGGHERTPHRHEFAWHVRSGALCRAAQFYQSLRAAAGAGLYWHVGRRGGGQPPQRGREQAGMKIVLYSKPDCGLCNEVKGDLASLQEEYALEVEERNILEDAALLARFQYLIPVVEIAGERLLYPPHDWLSLRNAFANSNAP